MAARTFVAAPPERWEHLADVVRERRESLGLTQEQAVARSHGGISTAVWSVLEGARQRSNKMEDRTLAAAAVVLGWEPGSLQDILFGGDPSEPEPIQMAASGTDLEALRVEDPDAYELLEDLARTALQRARDRAKK